MQATCSSGSVCGQCDIQCFVLFHSQTLTVPTNTEKTRSVNSSAQQYELMKWHWDLTEMLSFGQFGQAWNCMVNCIFQTIILRVCSVQFVRIVFDNGFCLNYELWDAGIFKGGNGNLTWKVDGNGNEYSSNENGNWYMGMGKKNPFLHGAYLYFRKSRQECKLQMTCL